MYNNVSGCYYHPNKLSVAVCSECGHGLCRDCIVKGRSGKTLCIDCANRELKQEFMVAELKEIGTMDTTSDSDFIPVENGAVSYAVLPESSAGEQIVNSAYYMDLAFMYPTSVMFVASAPDGQFTPQEKADAIAILSSFRAE